MTTKEEIYEIIKSFDIPVSYSVSLSEEFPRIIFQLVSNFSRRGSNRKVIQRQRYQITLLSEVPLDVANDPLLMKLEKSFDEKNFFIGNWEEITSLDEEIELASFQYILEVIK